MRINYPCSRCFEDATDYRLYRLADTSTKYDHTVLKNAPKMARVMTAQMKPHKFDTADLNFIIEFLKKFKLSCDTNRIHGGETCSCFISSQTSRLRQH